MAIHCLKPHGIQINGEIVSIHGATEPDAMEAEIRAAQNKNDSVGGIAEVTATGCPPGLGDPVFNKLDSAIAGAMMSIGAVKGVEIGEGFGAAFLFGSEMNDPLKRSGFTSNHAGGILGGISTGQDIVVRIAIKPTPSIKQAQHTVDLTGEEQEISVGGRHDPCIVPRIVPVAECMLALVIVDVLLEQVKYKWFGER